MKEANEEETKDDNDGFVVNDSCDDAESREEMKEANEETTKEHNDGFVVNDSCDDAESREEMKEANEEETKDDNDGFVVNDCCDNAESREEMKEANEEKTKNDNDGFVVNDCCDNAESREEMKEANEEETKDDNDAHESFEWNSLPKSNEDWSSEKENVAHTSFHTDTLPKLRDSSNIKVVQCDNHETGYLQESKQASYNENGTSHNHLTDKDHKSSLESKDKTKEVTNENHNKISNVDPTVLDLHRTNEHKKKSKKRKSGTDLNDHHPIKRVRKSRRLEEKRQARQLKPKVD
ncbi:hypothetical protein G9A89_021670 [Geosiphon pyriformis]|nr:hypothetical protein G9A89_021670 [Geosiphon pyriformis]